MDNSNGTPSQAFREEYARQRKGQCDRCGDFYPESRLRTQDGFTLCLPNCYDDGGTPTEKDAMKAEAQRIAARRVRRAQRPNPYRGKSFMDGVVVVTKIFPNPIELKAGIGVWVGLEGVGMSYADTIDLPHDPTLPSPISISGRLISGDGDEQVFELTYVVPPEGGGSPLGQNEAFFYNGVEYRVLNCSP